MTRVICHDSGHSLTRVNMRSSQSQVRVISQVTRVKSSHLGEISSQVKSKIATRVDSSLSQWLDLLQHCLGLKEMILYVNKVCLTKQNKTNGFSFSLYFCI